MAQNWNYADLSKAAKAAGGPENYVKMLELDSKKAGKIEMIPWICLSAVGSSLLTVAILKFINYYNLKKKQNQDKIEMRKEEIINGIDEFDATHEKYEKGVSADVN
jgi:hypothetical protein